jgi:hypothetical protein
VFIGFTSLTPVITMYFDAPLREEVRTVLLGGRKPQARRIGSSIASSVASTAGTRRQRQYNATRISHMDDNVGIDEGGDNWRLIEGSIEEETRAADAASRELLVRQLFGEGSATLTEKEEQDMQRARGFIMDVDRNMVPMTQDNKLVQVRPQRGEPPPPPPHLSPSPQLTGNDMKEDGFALKAVTTVHASPPEIAAFLHDYDSDYYVKAAERDLSVLDRFQVEGSDTGRSHSTFLRVLTTKGGQDYRTVNSRNTCGPISDDGSIVYASSPTGTDVPEEDAALACCR